MGRCHQKEDIRDIQLGVNLTEDQQKEMMKILETYKEVFTDAPGKSNLIVHWIVLNNENSVRSKPYSLPYAVRELKEEIEVMLDLGIIRESESPYASPIVIVKKKDGSNCICVDYRKLNKFTLADPEPMTTIEDLFRRLGKTQYFSKVDLRKGYWQIPVSGDDVRKTAFVTPDGCYEFLRMPFGMKNSGTTLVQGMRQLLSEMDNVSDYIDDSIVYTKD